MIILGIYEGHCSTACIMKDGKVIACQSEERFRRIKNYVGYPEKAIDHCLEIAGITGKEIDHVALASKNINLFWVLIQRESRFSVRDWIDEEYHFFKPLLIDKKPPKEIKREYLNFVMKKFNIVNFDYDISNLPKEDLDQVDWLDVRKKRITDHLGVNQSNIHAIDHHRGHAHYAFFASPKRDKDTLILTLDACGDDGVNATVSVWKEGEFKEIFRTTKSNIARLYRYITLLLGMKPNEHEYKVMGLAPYAKEYLVKDAYKVFSNTLCVEDMDFGYKEKPTDLYFYFKERLEGYRFDGIAGAIQKFCDDILTKWVKNCVKKTGIKNIVFSGGASMNIKTNLEIANLEEVEDLFVSPSGGDESLAIGACYALSHDLMDKNQNPGKEMKPLSDAYLGYEISDKEVGEFVKGINKKYKLIMNAKPEIVAELLVKEYVIARCAGRMEFGARALGNRSIMANPLKYQTIQKINEKIKNRDFWMPFTPSLLFEREKDYLINPKNLDSPYMTIGFESTELARKHLVAAIHPADFTIRPQIVKKEINPGYYAIIKAFEEKTGVGGILNTSFNLHGEPIVCTPSDAMDTFERSGLDGVLLNNTLILKPYVKLG